MLIELAQFYVLLTVHLDNLSNNNENQPDALFILNLFRQSTSTYFGHICPSAGGILKLLLIQPFVTNFNKCKLQLFYAL
jgi:hypothetical protein